MPEIHNLKIGAVSYAEIVEVCENMSRIELPTGKREMEKVISDRAVVTFDVIHDNHVAHYMCTGERDTLPTMDEIMNSNNPHELLSESWADEFSITF